MTEKWNHWYTLCGSSVKTSECNSELKCATIKLQRDKVKHTEGIVLPNAQVIREVKEDGQKYLSVLETDHGMCLVYSIKVTHSLSFIFQYKSNRV